MANTFVGVWRAGDDAHYLWQGVDWSSFHAKWNELSGQGLRLTDVTTYVDGGQRKWGRLARWQRCALPLGRRRLDELSGEMDRAVGSRPPARRHQSVRGRRPGTVGRRLACGHRCALSVGQRMGLVPREVDGTFAAGFAARLDRQLPRRRSAHVGRRVARRDRRSLPVGQRRLGELHREVEGAGRPGTSPRGRRNARR